MTDSRFVDNQQKCEILEKLDNRLLIDTVLEAIPIALLNTQIFNLANDMSDDIKEMNSLRRGIGEQRKQLLVLASKFLTLEQIQYGLDRGIINLTDARNQLEGAKEGLKP